MKNSIYVIDVERRNWSRRIRVAYAKGEASIGVTRRYLMIVEQPEIRTIIRKEFSSFPNAIYPHETGNDSMFYCIAGPSCRRAKRLVAALFYQLRKNNMPEADLNELEILTTGRGG